jgi:hypothetical protein
LPKLKIREAHGKRGEAEMIDLSDPTTLHGIYLVLARGLLSIDPQLEEMTDSPMDDAVQLIREQHEAGRLTITVDGDNWTVDVAERH